MSFSKQVVRIKTLLVLKTGWGVFGAHQNWILSSPHPQFPFLPALLITSYQVSLETDTSKDGK